MESQCSIIDFEEDEKQNNKKRRDSDDTLIFDHSSVNRNYFKEQPEIKPAIPIRIVKESEVNKKETKLLKGSKDLYNIIIETQNNKLSIKIMEINCFSPFYYQNSYTMEELRTDVSKSFRILDTIEQAKEALLDVFPWESTEIKFEEKNGEKKMILHFVFKVGHIDKLPVDFELNEKIVQQKDEALILLYQIEKNKNDLLDKINKICTDNVGNSVSKKILDLIKNNK